MEQGKPTSKWRPIFDVVSTVAMIALAVAILWKDRTPASGSPDVGAAGSRVPIPSEPIPIGDSATRGSSSARVAVIEYADFECSFCARFAQNIEPALREDYIDTGRVLLVFKHYPLSNHQNAPAAAQAAWCANRQQRFWELHERLFGLSGRLNGFSPEALGKDIAIDLAAYNSCRTGPEAEQAVKADRAEGERLKITGTPIFFFGKVLDDRRVQVSEVLSGAKPIEAFKAALDRLF